MPRTESFTYAGATLIAEEHEGPASGERRPAFLLVHGIGMGRSVFGDLAEVLSDVAPVVAVDLPGYGEAPEPVRILTIQRTADLLAAFVRASSDSPVVVAGHSMGAQIAVELAARHPGLVDRVVLLGPACDPAARTPLRQLWRLVRDIAVESPKVIAVGAREYVRAGPRLRMKFRAMLQHRPEDVFPAVAAPTLVIRGEHDVVAPRSWCEEVVRALPDGRLAEVEGHGHETMIRDAAPSAALILGFVG
ncbi:alpha/beta fold hydrolase [Microbacterium sp. NPDC055910]|uniref:alpha/beta fold hydrolase n=1 Tax=Microbacterium sp. NPDC055910 TaxID=3345659 RepID=UPI0035E23427